MLINEKNSIDFGHMIMQLHINSGRMGDAGLFQVDPYLCIKYHLENHSLRLFVYDLLTFCLSCNIFDSTFYLSRRDYSSVT